MSAATDSQRRSSPLSRRQVLTFAVAGAAASVAPARAMGANPGGPADAGTPPAGSGAAPAAPPHLTDIVPASGPAGAAYPLRATIRGAGFMSIGNIVEFGPVKLPDVPSPDARQITFAIPKIIPRRGEVPPIVLPPGEYRVTVNTISGTSNALIFILTPEP